MRSMLPYPTGSLVEISKIAASDEPSTGSASWEEWVPGSANNTGSCPVGYTMHGVLMRPVRVGGLIDLHRTHRNGVRINGHFVSTPVIAVSGDCLAETFNSVYLITPAGISGKEGE